MNSRCFHSIVHFFYQLLVGRHLLTSFVNPCYLQLFLFNFIPPAQKGLLHLSPDVYQEMEASRKQSGSIPVTGSSSTTGGSINYVASKDAGSCSTPVPPGHSPYYSGSSSSPSPTATMARELLLNGQSPPADGSLPVKGKNLACSVSVQPAQQLDYLAHIQGFQVGFRDVAPRRL